MNNKKVETGFMLDMETLSRKSNASIMSMAVVPFTLNRHHGAMVDTRHPSFYANVDVKGQSRDIESDTVKFWEKTDMEFLNNRPDQQNLGEVFAQMKDYIKSVMPKTKDVFIWAKPITFDMTILTTAHQQLQLDLFWYYYNTVDLWSYCRALGWTRNDLIQSGKKGDLVFNGDWHNAHDDAVYQIEQLNHVIKNKR